MGVYFTDQFSLLHLSVGIVVYFWKISFWNWFWLHLLYEWISNTEWGIYVINNYIPWQWGHQRRDTLVNMAGDQVYGLVGWIVGYLFVEYFYGGVLIDL